MKQLLINGRNKCLLSLLLVLGVVNSWAQDSTISETANKAESMLSKPWVWGVIAAIILLILAAIFTGSGKKEKIVTTTTVTEEKKIS